MIDDRGHQPLFPSVATTNRAGAEMAAQHLLASAVGVRLWFKVHGLVAPKSDLRALRADLRGRGPTHQR